MSSEQRLACVPGAIPADQRPAHVERSRHLFGTEVQEVTALEQGYAFRFPARALDDLFRFVGNERKCCPFLSFDLAITPDNGTVSLTLTGPVGTPAFLRAELPIGATLERRRSP